MFENLNERLTEVKEKGRRKEKWEHQLRKLKEELSGLEQAREAAAGRLADEEEDVARFHELHDQVKLRLAEVNKAVNGLESARRRIEQELVGVRRKYVQEVENYL